MPAVIPSTNFPVRYIRGLPREAQEDIYRDLSALAAAIDGAGSNETFDAVVDGGLTTDDEEARQFTTVFAAIQYLADTVGLTQMVIGLHANGATETANYGGTTSGLRVLVVGMPNAVAHDIADGDPPPWSWSTFNEQSKFHDLTVTGVAISCSTAGNMFNSTSIHVKFNRCIFTGSVSGGTGLPGGYYLNCALFDFRTSGTTNDCVIQDSLIWFSSNYSSVTWTASLFLRNVQVTTGANFTWTLSSTAYVWFDGLFAYNTSFMTGVGSSATPICTVACAAATSFTWHCANPTSNVDQLFSLSVTATALKWLDVSGTYQELTLPAIAGSSGMKVARINATVASRADVSGPAVLQLAMGNSGAPSTYALRLRGTGVTGMVTLRYADTASAATLLDYINVDRSVLLVAARLEGAASTGVKVYNLDASSTHNIIVLEADLFGGTSADAGSNNLIITDAGLGSATPSGPAGGDLAGTYPNPTLADLGLGAGGPTGSPTVTPIISYDTKGRLTAVSSATITGVVPGGSAGGALAGTYPNPTLAPTQQRAYGAKVNRTATQNINTATDTALSFTAADSWDDNSLHDPGGGNPTRITVDKAGTWRFTAYVQVSADATGRRLGKFRVNGTTEYPFAVQPAPPTGSWGVSGSRTIEGLAISDYVEVVVEQSSGSTLTMIGDCEAGYIGT